MARNAVKLTSMVYGTITRYPVQSLWREEALISTVYVKMLLSVRAMKFATFPFGEHELNPREREEKTELHGKRPSCMGKDRIALLLPPL